MAYHSYLLSTNMNIEEWRNAICPSLDSFFRDQFAADAVHYLKDFDAESTLKNLQAEVQDNARCYILHPPRELPQRPYIYIRTADEMGSTVLPKILAVAVKHHLSMYDGRTNTLFNPNKYIDQAFFDRSVRERQIRKIIHETWNQKTIWRVSHVYSTKHSRKRMSYNVVTVKKNKEKSFFEKILEFRDALQACLLPHEKLICSDQRFTVDGTSYAIVFYLEGYKHANLVGYIQDGKPKTSVLYRMGYLKMAEWLAALDDQDLEDTLARLEFDDMIEDYPDLMYRLSASIKLTKELQTFLPNTVSIGPIDDYQGANVCIHVLPSDLYHDKGSISKLRIEDTEFGLILFFIDDICPYLYDRLYFTTFLPIESLRSMVERIKEIRTAIIQDPEGDLIKYYCNSSKHYSLSPDYFSEHQAYVIKLFGLFIRWSERQLDLYLGDETRNIAIIGP